MARQNTPPAPSDPSYTVGFRKPPLATRFKPGQSGNPRGRPKASTRPPPPRVGGLSPAEETILRVMREHVTIEVDGSQLTVSRYEAILRAAAGQAALGDMRALRFVMDLFSAALAAEADAQNQEAEDAQINLNLVGELSAALNHAKHTGFDFSKLRLRGDAERASNVRADDGPDPNLTLTDWELEPENRREVPRQDEMRAPDPTASVQARLAATIQEGDTDRTVKSTGLYDPPLSQSWWASPEAAAPVKREDRGRGTMSDPLIRTPKTCDTSVGRFT